MKLNYLLSIALVFGAASLSVVGQDCNYWYASVGVKSSDKRRGPMNKADTGNILSGIECLLRLEGDKSRGAFTGATSSSGMFFMPEATVEIDALYYISVLFYRRYDHALAVALRSTSDTEEPKINSDEVVKAAFESYRRWFAKVKEIGFEEARRRKLDPLEGSNVVWAGGSVGATLEFEITGTETVCSGGVLRLTATVQNKTDRWLKVEKDIWTYLIEESWMPDGRRVAAKRSTFPSGVLIIPGPRPDKPIFEIPPHDSYSREFEIDTKADRFYKNPGLYSLATVLPIEPQDGNGVGSNQFVFRVTPCGT
ncbi:MAG: hypothetical protein UZ17_ACD001000010 [Acidobacteria bacterium OLB17]|nr:MAG: hypothetical protein UZ17_ACD001000010 [Acidobacteria bacterium OLB17]MCZ2391511.1 hypothetical protein [Acidobacteriota bacterium]